jgi:putative DNA primase/helicase
MKLISLEAAERQARDKNTKPRAVPNDVITEDSAALEFSARHCEQLRYCHDTAAWFKWGGNSWRVEKTGLAFEWARLLARSISEDADAKTRALINRTTFAAGVERFARSDRKLAETAEYWDRDPFLLGTPGGTVDLVRGSLRPGNPQDGITKETAVAPARTADCPRWMDFLDEATGGDAELIRFLQQWAGYSLTGDTREHALVFVFGPGGNGKSVFLNALTGILKDYATTAAMDAFTHSHGDKHPTDLAMLRGARLVTASETEEGRAWAEARIKALTGGDPITARFMRQDFFTFVPSFKLTVVGNHQPVLRNVDDAARRRFNIVPFVRKPETPDKRLEEKLKTEWPGILRWMIDGCLDWQKNGLVRPESVNAATNDYFSEQDVFRQWLDDECDVEPGNDYKWETTAELFASWTSYAKAAGELPGTLKTFAPAMRRHGFTDKRTKQYRGWAGLRLIQDENRRGDG